MRVFKMFILWLLVATLASCGSENANETTVLPEGDFIQAPVLQDSFTSILLSNDNKIVSLKKNVRDPQGLPITLERVRSLSSECEDPIIDKKGMSFTIKKNVPETCYYNYTVKNHADNPAHDKKASASSYVLISTKIALPTLPSLSQTAVIDEIIVIDLQNELVNDFPTGYQLEAQVIVLGSGHATTNEIDNKITYTAMTKGVTRLLYSLVSNDGLDVKAGFIDIAVSGSRNMMPTALNFSGPEDVAAGAIITIDVKDHIDDLDGDPLQLTDVYAFNANVASADPDDVNNTKFTFSSNQIGVYDISYHITDHRDGWSVGVVRISVEGAKPPWDDIILLDKTLYTAPWEKLSADAYSLPYQTTESETILGQNYDITLFDYTTAETLCHDRGMALPSVTQLQNLFQERGNVNTSDDWPVVQSYWTTNVSSKTENISYNLTNGVTWALPTSTPLIVTCIYPGELTVKVIQDNASTTTDINSTSFDIVEATVLETNGTPLNTGFVYMYTTAPNLYIQQSGKQVDPEGKAEFEVRSSEAGSFNVTLSFLSQQVNAIVTFVEETITSIIVSGTTTLNVNDSGQLTATTLSSSGESSDVTNGAFWLSDNPTIVSVAQDGSVVGNQIGTTTITASVDGQTSAPHTIVVVDAWGPSGRFEVTPVSVTLVEGTQQQFSSTAYSLANPQGKNVTGETNWSLSAGAANASISINGDLTANKSGSVTVLGQYSLAGIVKQDTGQVTITPLVVEPTLQSLTLRPNVATISVGENVSAVAIATFTDGSEVTVTLDAVWRSNNGSVSVNGMGLITGNSAVTGAIVTATYGGLSAQATINVNPLAAVLQEIIVSPATVTMDVGATTPLTATAKYSDGSSIDVTIDANWSSNNTNVSVNSTGTITGNNAVTGVKVTATYGGLSAQATVNVNSLAATLQEIIVSPSSAVINVGATTQLSATASYSDGSSVNITSRALWSSSNSNIATVNNGQVTGIAQGSSIMTASFEGQSDTSSITVNMNYATGWTLKTIEIRSNMAFMEDKGPTDKWYYQDGITTANFSPTTSIADDQLILISGGEFLSRRQASTDLPVSLGASLYWNYECTTTVGTTVWKRVKLKGQVPGMDSIFTGGNEPQVGEYIKIDCSGRRP